MSFQAPLTRQLQLDATRADRKARRVPVVISSEYPVDRPGYREVLLHGTENVDLSRTPLPLIESHDASKVNVGLVENLRLVGRKLRGDLVLGNSARANELWPDIEAGIVRFVSVAYRVLDYSEDGDTVSVTRWRPHETSFVSVPADPTVGTYRSASLMPYTEDGAAEGDALASPEGRLSRRARRALASAPENLALEAERERCETIIAIGESYASHDCDKLINGALRRGATVDEFRAEVLAKLQSFPRPSLHVSAPESGIYGSGSGDQAFSFTRALASMVQPGSVDAGYEREVSQELARSLGRKPRGMWMPIIDSRALTVGGAPDLVGEQHMGGQFIDSLRARSFVLGMGARMLTGLTEDISIPRRTASSTAQWIAGDGSDGLTESTPDFDSVKLTPRTVGALTRISRKMILQGSPDAEQTVREDFAKILAEALDLAALAGTGTGNQPRGIINTPGVTVDKYPAAGPGWADIVGAEGAVAADNADMGYLAYLTTPDLRTALKIKEIAEGTARHIWVPGSDPGRGQMNGYPAYASSNTPADHIVFGNWNDLLVGTWGAIDVMANPYADGDFARGTVQVRIFASVDFGVRHPKSFVVLTRGT